MCPSLSLKHRIYGFAFCLVLGSIIGFLNAGMIKAFINSDSDNKKPIIKFIILYTLGIGLTIGGSMFLWGPAK